MHVAQARGRSTQAVVLTLGVLAWLAAGPLHRAAAQAGQRFGTADSRSQYVHRIQLLDANKKVVDPKDPGALPYSPMNTCGKCHDVKTMSHGWHFNYTDPTVPPGRAGEPWFFVDNRSGTQIPLSYRKWPGAYAPGDIGVSAFEFATRFGRHLPGGGAGELTEPTPESRWKLSGPLMVDCMMCHSADRSYSPQVWAEQIAEMNFAWAPTAALGLAKIDGAVKNLLPDADPARPETMKGKTLPKTLYNAAKFNADNEVFFDVLRRPPSNNCYYCHSSKSVGPTAAAKWTHDNDVHLKAGLSCADCHRNDVPHNTVRGYEGEKHPSGVNVASLSCRGCHLGDAGSTEAQLSLGGRLAAPRPLHAGLPTLHLEKLSCTTCHSGPIPGELAELVWTSMAHELGLKSQTREPSDLPNIVQTVFKPDAQGMVHPYRQAWPAFWGTMEGESIKPLDPDAVYDTLRRVLRIRRDFRQEIAATRLTADERARALGDRAKLADKDLTAADRAQIDAALRGKSAEEFAQKLAAALKELATRFPGSRPVYLSGGKVYLLDSGGEVQTTEHAAAKPYAWPIGHDVRPARQSLGVKGCVECHSPGSRIFYSTATAVGPAPDARPVTTNLRSEGVIEPRLLEAWEQSFAGHFTFKILATVAFGIICAVLVLYGLLGLGGVLKLADRRGLNTPPARQD